MSKSAPFLPSPAWRAAALQLHEITQWPLVGLLQLHVGALAMKNLLHESIMIMLALQKL